MIIISAIINVWLLSLIYRLATKPKESDPRISRMIVAQSNSLKAQREYILKCLKRNEDRIYGYADKIYIKSKIAEKFAERSFNLASSANLGVVALQKALATPRMITREQSKLNQLAKNSVDELFTTKGEYDWLKPLLSDQDLDLLEEIEQKKIKDQMKAPPQ